MTTRLALFAPSLALVACASGTDIDLFFGLPAEAGDPSRLVIALNDGASWTFVRPGSLLEDPPAELELTLFEFPASCPNVAEKAFVEQAGPRWAARAIAPARRPLLAPERTWTANLRGGRASDWSASEPVPTTMANLFTEPTPCFRLEPNLRAQVDLSDELWQAAWSTPEGVLVLYHDGRAMLVGPVGPQETFQLGRSFSAVTLSGAELWGYQDGQLWHADWLALKRGQEVMRKAGPPNPRRATLTRVTIAAHTATSASEVLLTNSETPGGIELLTLSSSPAWSRISNHRASSPIWAQPGLWYAAGLAQGEVFRITQRAAEPEEARLAHRVTALRAQGDLVAAVSQMLDLAVRGDQGWIEVRGDSTEIAPSEPLLVAIDRGLLVRNNREKDEVHLWTPGYGWCETPVVSFAGRAVMMSPHPEGWVVLHVDNAGLGSTTFLRRVSFFREAAEDCAFPLR